MRIPNSPLHIVKAKSDFDCEECSDVIKVGSLCVSVWHTRTMAQRVFSHASYWMHFHPTCALRHYDGALQSHERKAIGEILDEALPQAGHAGRPG